MLRVLFYLVILGALIYAVFWTIGRRNSPPTTPPSVPRGPVGPDDDDDFLRELERKRKHRPDAD